MKELLVSFAGPDMTWITLPESRTATFYGGGRHQQVRMPATPAAYAYILWVDNNLGVPTDLSGGVVRLQNVCVAAAWDDFRDVKDPDTLEIALTAYYCEAYSGFATRLRSVTAPQAAALTRSDRGGGESDELRVRTSEGT